MHESVKQADQPNPSSKCIGLPVDTLVGGGSHSTRTRSAVEEATGS